MLSGSLKKPFKITFIYCVMKYKILLLSITLNVAFATFTLAQEKPLDLSIKAYGGYGLLTPHGDFFTDITSYNTGVFHNIKYGRGSGVHAGAGLLLKLNDIISVGIDLDYLTGSKTAPNNTSGDTVQTTFKSSNSVFSLIPNVSFKLFSKPGYHIYTTMGIITALKTKFDINTTSVGGATIPGTSPFTSTGSQKYKYGINLGFQDAFGVQFRIAKNMSLFGQITGYYLPSSPKSLEADNKSVFTSDGGTSTSEFIAHATFKSGANAGYAHKSEINGGVFTSTYETFPQPQRIFSIGLNAGVVFDLNK